MLTTGAASNIHDCLVQVRVLRDEDNKAALPALLEYLHREGQVNPTIVPFSDGAKDQVLVSFTCSSGRANAHIKVMKDNSWYLDCSVLKLAVSKDMRASAPGDTVNAEVKHTFKETIASRIAVENMLSSIHEGANFSFDFCMLIICAAVVAATGLMTNNSVSIVAAMLISPLMSPILAFTFGTVVRDVKLIKVGISSTLLGMLLCELIGFFGGLIAAPVSVISPPTWPTNEMYSRGQPSALYIGVAIAVPSGIAVALSLTSSNTSGLVGVAISASLLPPVVNSGILFAQACFQSAYYLENCKPYTDWEQCCQLSEASGILIPTPSCPSTNVKEFCCLATQFDSSAIATMGGYSLALTVVNIFCIWVFASLTFLLKEVAPLPNKSEFWSVAVPATRTFNRMWSSVEPGWRKHTVQAAMRDSVLQGKMDPEAADKASKRILSVAEGDEEEHAV